MSNGELILGIFLQLAFILITVRAAGRVARLAGQPQVVGEMIAGILIGPSLFGHFFPETQGQLFPKQSLPVIYCLSQIGLLFYMFIVGAEFNKKLLAANFQKAASLSASGIVAPFALGGLLGFILAETPDLFGPGIQPWQAALFIGSAMSITAFPVLARIIYERGISGTKLGTLVLSAGAIDDAAAWTLFALVLSTTQHAGSWAKPLLAIGGGIAFAAVALLIVRPALAPLETDARKEDAISISALNIILILLMLSAWFTDFAGIHSVFGAFILGAAMPRGVITRDLQNIIEPITTNFFLPLFFMYSGLNTRITMLSDVLLWQILAAVVLVACLGKGAACYFASRRSGSSRREATAIGALMNARGLMELILLNIGLEKGIITPGLFTVMAIMAIVTTVMATPIFNLAYEPESKDHPAGKVLILNFRKAASGHRHEPEDYTESEKFNRFR